MNKNHWELDEGKKYYRKRYPVRQIPDDEDHVDDTGFCYYKFLLSCSLGIQCIDQIDSDFGPVDTQKL